MRGAAMRAGALRREDEFAAAGAELELASARTLLVVARKRARNAPAVRIFHDDLEASEIERLARRVRDLHDALAQPLPGERARAVIAERIVAALPGKAVRHPGAAAAAHVPV